MPTFNGITNPAIFEKIGHFYGVAHDLKTT